MRKLVSLVFVFSIMMLFVLAVAPAFAKPGGIKVDSDDDCIADREDNEITDNTSIFVWLNVNSSQGCAADDTAGECNKCFELIAHSTGAAVDCGDEVLVFEDDLCGGRPDYLIADLGDDCFPVNDLYTLIVHQTNSCASGTLGADSFSVEN